MSCCSFSNCSSAPLCVTQREALDQFEKEQQDIAELAAKTAWQVQRMSEKAQAEFARAEDTTSAHVVDVVGSRRGRPKAVAPADPSDLEVSDK